MSDIQFRILFYLLSAIYLRGINKEMAIKMFDKAKYIFTIWDGKEVVKGSAFTEGDENE